jgi:hypothetical protein
MCYLFSRLGLASSDISFKAFMDHSCENGRSNDSGFLNEEDDDDDEDERYEIETADVGDSKKQPSKVFFRNYFHGLLRFLLI